MEHKLAPLKLSRIKLNFTQDRSSTSAQKNIDFIKLAQISVKIKSPEGHLNRKATAGKMHQV